MQDDTKFHASIELYDGEDLIDPSIIMSEEESSGVDFTEGVVMYNEGDNPLDPYTLRHFEPEQNYPNYPTYTSFHHGWQNTNTRHFQEIYNQVISGDVQQYNEENP